MTTFIESFAKELEQESIGTKKLLALVPADKADWKPHEKSMALKTLATHIAEIPGWIAMGLKTDELDFATTPYNPKDCNTAAELVSYFEENVTKAKETLAEYDDSVLNDSWTMRNGEAVYFTMSKHEVIRHSFGQLIHHRAQLGIYLRLLNIPIPGVYGPSADETSMM